MAFGSLTWFLIVSVGAHDTVEMVQTNIAGGGIETATQRLIHKVVEAAEERIRKGADRYIVAEEAAHASADAVKQLGALEGELGDSVVDDEIAAAQEVVAELYADQPQAAALVSALADTGICTDIPAPKNGNIGNCGAHLGSGDSCRPGCNAGYALQGLSKCEDGNLESATCVERSCGGIAAPRNGYLGNCGTTLASRKSCKPGCNAGYTLEGITTCTKGALTSATCEEKGCAGLTAPKNGGMGNCGETLGSRDSCVPSCNLYYEPSGQTRCFSGVLAAASCSSMFDCNAGSKYWNIGWSNAKQEHCCPKEEFCKEPCSLIRNRKITASREIQGCFVSKAGLSESDCKFYCRVSKYVELCEVWMYQKSDGVCRHWAQCANQITDINRQAEKNTGFISGVCNVPSFPCSTVAPSNGNDGDCGKTLASGDTCKPGCNAGYTIRGVTSCTRGTLTAAGCVESPCTVTAPENGGMGGCRGTMPSGSSCKPSCEVGYTLVGQTSCSKGSVATAKCKESDCKVFAPENGGAGNCARGLKSGDSCSPSCNHNTLLGDSRCLKGQFKVATCPTIYEVVTEIYSCGGGNLNVGNIWSTGILSGKHEHCPLIGSLGSSVIEKAITKCDAESSCAGFVYYPTVDAICFRTDVSQQTQEDGSQTKCYIKPQVG